VRGRGFVLGLGACVRGGSEVNGRGVFGWVEPGTGAAHLRLVEFRGDLLFFCVTDGGGAWVGMIGDPYFRRPPNP
jgi:hypothetical protein